MNSDNLTFDFILRFQPIGCELDDEDEEGDADVTGAILLNAALPCGAETMISYMK